MRSRPPRLKWGVVHVNTDFSVSMKLKKFESVITVTVKSSNKQCVELTQDSALRNSTVCMSQNNPPQAENTHSIDRCDSTGRNRAIHDLTGVTSY